MPIVSLSRRGIGLLIFSIALLALRWESLRALVGHALDWDNTEASQVVLIPFISAALILLKRQEIFRGARLSPFAGGVLALAGGVLMALEGTLGSPLAAGDRLALTTFSTLVLWVAGFLFFHGPAAVKAAAFPLGFLILCCPIPSPVLDYTIAFLQQGSADMSYVVFRLTGTPVYRDGFIFMLPNVVIEVAEECSGIRSGISLFILSLLAGNVVLKSKWKWFVLLIATIPILILKNALRIGVLTLLAVHYDPRFLTGRLHEEGGIPFFILGLLLIYPILMLLVKSERRVHAVAPVASEAKL